MKFLQPQLNLKKKYQSITHVVDEGCNVVILHRYILGQFAEKSAVDRDKLPTSMIGAGINPHRLRFAGAFKTHCPIKRDCLAVGG